MKRLLVWCLCLWAQQSFCTTLYVVRHAQTDWNAQKKIQGQIDIPLNAVGREQALALAKTLGRIAFDLCMTSDLQRAVETARILLAERPIEIRIEERLTQRRESEALFHRRVMNFLQRVVQEHPDACILLVTHGGVMRHIVQDIWKVRASAVLVDNMAVLKLAASLSGMQIEHMNAISIDEMR